LFSFSGRIFCGEPVPTSPENALRQARADATAGYVPLARDVDLRTLIPQGDVAAAIAPYE
jgi:hypothetical protein